MFGVGIAEGASGDVYAQYVGALAEYNLRRADFFLEQGLIAVTGQETPPGMTVSERAMQVFPTPTQIRAQAVPNLDADQLTRLRPVGRELGIGRKGTILPSGLMIPGRYMAVAEGGLEWKMKGEVDAAVTDSSSHYCYQVSCNSICKVYACKR